MRKKWTKKFHRTMKNQKGFIQITILIAIIAGILILGGAGYFGTKQYQNYKATEAEKEKQAQEQRSALQEAQTEIEKLKTANESTQEKQNMLEKTIKIDAQKPQSISISASEINCKDSAGSGSLWNIDSKKIVLTNEHVITDPLYSSLHKQSYCTVWVNDSSDSFESTYSVFPLTKRDWNSYTDVAVMDIIAGFYPTGQVLLDWMQKPIEQMNYKMSTLRKCPTQIETGSPVVVIGYPASGKQEILGGAGRNSARIITNGVVSGYDKTVTLPLGPLPYQNYFVSAKIDSGNSGGIAIAKTEAGLCVLGIPTWLNVGNYDTQGLIQNIHNVMYKI